MVKKNLLILLIFCGFVLFLNAQASKGLSFNGSTGLISTPTAHIGWEKSAEVGLDIGAHYFNDNGETSLIGNATVSLMKKFELGLAYDTNYDDIEDNEDVLLTGKFQFYNAGNTAAGIGANYQMLEGSWANGGEDLDATQIYIVATYSGVFINMPASTTIVVGKTFYENVDDDNIDFSMGFELSMFPKLFKNYVYWISDFSNYSYSVDAVASNAGSRGCFNTGMRIDPFKGGKTKLVIDVIMTDALDANRAFSIGGTIGFGLK